MFISKIICSSVNKLQSLYFSQDKMPNATYISPKPNAKCQMPNATYISPKLNEKCNLYFSQAECNLYFSQVKCKIQPSLRQYIFLVTAQVLI